MQISRAKGRRKSVILDGAASGPLLEDDERIIRDVLAPYWTGRDFTPNFVNALPDGPVRFHFPAQPIAEELKIRT